MAAGFIDAGHRGHVTLFTANRITVHIRRMLRICVARISGIFKTAKTKQRLCHFAGNVIIPS